MSDEPITEMDSGTASRRFRIENVPEIKAAVARIQSHRETAVRLVAVLFLFGSMFSCWRSGETMMGSACLLAWAVFERLVKKSSGRLRPTVRSVAKRIELLDPRLQGRLSTAVEQVGDDAGFSYVQLRLFEEVSERAKSANWERCVSPLRFGLATSGLRVAQVAAFLAVMLFLFHQREIPATGKPEAGQATASQPTPALLPGNTEIEKGTRLSVSARLKDFAPDVFLGFRATAPDSSMSGKISMAQAVGEPLYGAAVESVERDLEYWVETAFGSSEHYVAKVFEFPRLQRSDALVRFPQGSEPAERGFENARKLTVPEGSSVSWEFRFNKPVKTARMVHKDGRVEELALAAAGTVSIWKPQAAVGAVEAKLDLADSEGRAAKEQVAFRIQVVPNASAKIRPILPRGGARFTMVEEVDFEAEVWDDSNLLRWGMSIQFGTGQVEEFVLGTNAKGGKKARMHRLEALEERRVKVGDSVSWFFWAEDLDGAGKTRRMESDLYLGRVRAFEEEYRQNDSEEKGEDSGDPQLLELQKHVMAATWNVKRTLGNAAKPDAEAAKNLGIVRASETKVLERAQEKAEGESDERRRGFYREAVLQLEKAVRELQASASDTARVPAAIEAERAAYAALTHVVPSSYMMTHSRNPNAARMEEKTGQMSNLDFAKREDRYQSKSDAMGDKEQEERSQMEELLAQLRALARRQEEILERMRDLESRIRDSSDEKEREASKRDLKKLSDEQRALAQELENAQHKAAERNEALATQTQELDAARQAAQRAAAALEKGSLDEARASAARSSEKLRAGGDTLRQQLSGRTREAARELQERAQELASQEKKIAEALDHQKQGPARLAEPGLDKEVESQRKRLKALQEEMQRAAEATEVSEPLFSKALQDAHRSTVQHQIELKFKVVEDAIASRRQDVARRAEKSAADDVQELARAVEKAADEVLGDDAQALRQARAAVDKIARELSEEAGLTMNGQPGRPIEDASRAADRPATEAIQAGSKDDPEGAGSRRGEAGGKPGAVSRGAPTLGPEGSGRSAEDTLNRRGARGTVGGDHLGGSGGLPAQAFGDLLNRLDRVESLLERPQLRAGVARVQQAAEELRAEMKRKASKPSQHQLQQSLMAPLTELRDAISSELARREGRESDAPVDRDPVPRKYETSVRRYYEALGGGK